VGEWVLLVWAANRTGCSFGRLPASRARASTAPGTSVSFTVFPAPVTVSGGPGIVVTNVWSHGVLTISAD